MKRTFCLLLYFLSSLLACSVFHASISLPTTTTPSSTQAAANVFFFLIFEEREGKQTTVIRRRGLFTMLRQIAFQQFCNALHAMSVTYSTNTGGVRLLSRRE